MSKLLGCVLIASGIALASATISQAEPQDSRRAQVSETAGTAAPAVPAQAKPQPARLQPRRPREIVVTPEAMKRRPVASPDTAPMASDTASITRALQTELRRVGCYAGDSTGVWSAPSRTAMKAFMDRVNASLPVDRPDFILLSLVRAHEGPACGASCPAGQIKDTGGRCLPQAIVAKANRKAAATKVAHARPAQPAPVATPPKVIARKLPEVAAAPPPPAPVEPGKPFASETPRMSLAGPVPNVPPPAVIAEEKSPAEQKRADRAKERERRLAAERKPVKAGQTRWARDFFRKGGGAFF